MGQVSWLLEVGIESSGPQMDSPVLGGWCNVNGLFSMSVPGNVRSDFHVTAQLAGTGIDCSMEPMLLAALVLGENFVANVEAGASGRWACMCLTLLSLFKVIVC